MLLILFWGLAYVLLPSDAVDCNRTPPFNTDCSAALMNCPLFTSSRANGRLIGTIEKQQPNTRSQYRTCFIDNRNCRATRDNGIEDDLIETEGGSQRSSLGEYSTLQRIESPNFNISKPNYKKSIISRYNIHCHTGMQLQYSFQVHHLEQSEKCENTPNTCIDFVRIDFPTYNMDDITCGPKNTLSQTIGIDGMNEIDVEFATNRLTNRPGVQMFVYCRDPAFDAHFPNPSYSRKRRTAEGCTLPSGFGPRNESFEPPRAKRIRDFLANGSGGLFLTLEVGENLTYINNTVMLSNGTSYTNIMCLTVENRIATKTMSGSSTGTYGGFAQLAVSGEKAVMVQFGVRPIYQPTEEEAVFIRMLESGIREVLPRRDESLPDRDDEIDAFPRFNITSRISRRSVDFTFLNKVALEFGNACNGFLRGVACHYQELVMNENCLDEFEPM